MGKNAPQKFSESRVRKSITNYELRITNWKPLVWFPILWCAFAFSVSGQILTPTDLEPLILRISKGNDEQKRDALYQIRNLKTAEASRIALPALKDSSEIVRATAAYSVIFLPSDEAAQNLLPLLNDKKELVRRETAYALGKTRSRLAVQPLIQKFQKEKSGDVRNACVVALGEIGDVSAINFLTQTLQKNPKKEDESNDFLRRSAARSIGQIAEFLQTGKTEILTPENLLIADEKKQTIIASPYKNLSADSTDFRSAVPTLIKILQNPNEQDDAKRESAFALGAIADNSATQILQTNLNAADYYLARICKESLEKLEKVGR